MEYSSDSVTLTVKREPNCKVTFEAKAAKPLLQSAYQKAIKEVAKNVSVPGFRKGKAPNSLIEKKFKKELDGQWHKTLADMTYSECETLAKIPPVSRDAKINFEMKNISDEEAEMHFSFEGEPEVPTIDPSAIKIEGATVDTVASAKVDETIAQIKTFFATYDEVKDRAAQEGDFARIDVEIIEEEPAVKALDNMRIEIGKERMAKWMFDLISGMSVGESKDGVSEPDPDLPEEEKIAAGEPKKVRLTLLALEEAKLPEVDDAFAEKLGAKDPADIREKLTSLLTNRAEEEKSTKLRDQVASALIDTFPFDLPQTMIDREAQYRLQQLSSDQAFIQTFMGLGEEERKAEIEKIKEQGARAVRLFYICRKIVEDNKLEINPDELEKSPETPLEAMFMSQPPSKEETQEQKALAISRLMLTKAQDFVISQASKS